MRKSEEEQNIFLSICSAYDRDVLTGKEEMKKEDFERITHITMALGFIPYTQLICSLHMDLAVELEEHEEREREIYLEYPEYYDDEEIYEKYDKWIEDFAPRYQRTGRNTIVHLSKRISRNIKPLNFNGFFQFLPKSDNLDRIWTVLVDKIVI